MGRCADCASYPWNVSFDPSTFTAIKCDERLKAKRWTPERRDSENDCQFFKDKNAKPVVREPVVEKPEVVEMVPEPVKVETVKVNRRGRNRG